MTGMKFKVAHKRADTEKWSASERAQRKRMIKFLQETIRATGGAGRPGTAGTTRRQGQAATAALASASA